MDVWLQLDWICLSVFSLITLWRLAGGSSALFWVVSSCHSSYHSTWSLPETAVRPSAWISKYSVMILAKDWKPCECCLSYFVNLWCIDLVHFCLCVLSMINFQILLLLFFYFILAIGCFASPKHKRFLIWKHSQVHKLLWSIKLSSFHTTV